jgi:tetratricopeptide (TPR) repeat protein
VNIPRLASSLLSSSLLASSLLSAAIFASAQTPDFVGGAQIVPGGDAATERMLRHESSDWLLMAPHLPNPTTASTAQLELAGDVLRARRMTEDALDFYEFALVRGGSEASVRNRIGVTELELRHPELARIAFNRVLKLDHNNSQAWNNLGATDYLAGDYRSAISHYRRAIKLSPDSAVFRSNLGTAYFEIADYDSARSEFAQALKLDPKVFDQGGWSGLQAHVISTRDRGRFCAEMARMAALNHNDAGVLHWLDMAVSSDPEAVNETLRSAAFDRYRKDPRVLLLLQNARILRSRQVAVSTPIPTLTAPTNEAIKSR